MTNKKLKMAAMSVALTACVAASPLAANADAPEAAPVELEKEPVAEETKKEETTAEPQVNQKAKNAQETLKDAEVKYDKEHPTTNPDGSQKLDGVIVTNPEGSGETGSEEKKPEEKVPEEKKPEEIKPEEKEPEEKKPEEKEPEEKKPEEKDPEEIKPEEIKPEQIGTAEKTEKSETNVETKPNPGAEPIVDTTTPPTVEKNPDGSTTITQPTVTPGTETTTTTGTGEAKGDLHEKVEEVPKEEINLDKELGENPNISWDIKKGDEAVNDYKVEEVTNSDDGNKQTLKLKKEEKTTAEMTAEDIAKLVDAEKPTVNPDGTYTLTRTETILDAEGNPQTRTTYITIRDNKVTTKTTTELTITREKIEHNEEASIPTDVVLPDVKLNNNETLSHTKLDEMLKEKGGKDANGVKDGEYTYKETAEDGTVREYTIKIDTTSTDQLTNKEIVDKLNDKLNSDRYSAEGEDIYYRADNGERVKLDVKQKAALRRNLSVNISVTETKKDTKTEAPGKETAENEAKMNAANDAVKNALMKMGLNETEALEALNVGTLNTADHTFTATYKGKNYTLNYTAPTTSEDPSKVTDLPNEPGKTTDTKEHTVTGTAYVTGSTITYQAGAEYKTTGVDTLGMGADFKTAPKDAVPESIQWDTAGRIAGYTDTKGNTHTFEYDDNVTLDKLSPEEKAALEAAAKQKQPDWDTEIKEATLTRVKWTVKAPRTETPQTTPIEKGETVDLSEKTWSSQTDNNGTVDFTHDNTTYTGMTLENESGNVKTYKKTDADKTVTIITVTTQQLNEEEIKAKFDKKFGEGKYTRDAKAGTVTYTGEDGKTYTASYVAQEEKLTVEVQKPQPDVVTGTGSTKEEAENAFRAKLDEARKKAEDDGEQLVIEYDDNGVIKTLIYTSETKWEEVIKVVGHVVNYNAMTDAELVTYLKELETAAKNTGKYYDGSTEGNTPYYRDAAGKMQRLPKGVVVQTGWKTDWFGIPHKYNYVVIDDEEREVLYGNNDIAHLDLATDSKLTLSEKDKDGKAMTDDCVLLNNPTLTWHENAETLVKGSDNQAHFVNRITYDDEGDNNSKTGHYEYARKSWDGGSPKDDNAPKKSVFYKVEGKVAYGKLGNEYRRERWESYQDAKRRAENDLEKYKSEHPELDLSKAKVVEIYENQNTTGSRPRYYQIYLYQSDLTAYGYMSDDNNTCGNAIFNVEGDIFNPPQSYFFGGYDLTLGDLTQIDKEHVVAKGKNTIALSATVKRTKKLQPLTNKELNYTPKSVTETIPVPGTEIGSGKGLSGSYRANYTKTEDYRDEQQQGGIEGHGTDSYKSFTNLIRNIFKGEDTGTVEGGSIKYVYHSEKNKDGTPVKFEADKMVVTTKQDAEVHYTFTSQESRDVWIKGYTQTVVPPVNPGPDSPELPPVEDAKPAPAPEAPVLPVVQDARPDPAPAPAPAPAPETPVLPAVQDAKLIQTGTSGWLADLMLGAGTVLSAAGYWMERKRKAMFYKSQH